MRRDLFSVLFIGIFGALLLSFLPMVFTVVRIAIQHARDRKNGYIEFTAPAAVVVVGFWLGAAAGYIAWALDGGPWR